MIYIIGVCICDIVSHFSLCNFSNFGIFVTSDFRCFLFSLIVIKIGSNQPRTKKFIQRILCFRVESTRVESPRNDNNGSFVSHNERGAPLVVISQCNTFTLVRSSTAESVFGDIVHSTPLSLFNSDHY